MEEYRFQIDDDRGIDSVRCPRLGSSFLFARKGAELVSYRIFDVRKGEQTGLLYRDGDTSAPAGGWKNHATVLFPVVGRLKNNKSRMGGKTIRFDGNHGFARNTLFELAGHGVREGRAFLTYSTRATGATREIYPFDFSFDVNYEIDGVNLAVIFRAVNTSPDEDLYFSCGWHPGFSITGSKFTLTVAGENILRFPVAGSGLLSGEEMTITARELESAAQGDLSRALAVKLPDREGRECALVDEEKHILISLTFKDFEFLGVWRDTGCPFICLEPWQGTDDCEDQAPFDKKLGIVRLEPGGERRFRIEVRPRIL